MTLLSSTVIGEIVRIPTQLEIECADKIYDGKQGAIHLSELTAIWIYNVDKKMFENNIENIIASYNELHPNEQICQDKRQF